MYGIRHSTEANDARQAESGWGVATIMQAAVLIPVRPDAAVHEFRKKYRGEFRPVRHKGTG